MPMETMEPGPDTRPRSPGFDVPPGACDCHFHVFVHSPQYPFSANSHYLPSDAPNEAYLAMRKAIGIERSVLVHPTPYGTDNRLLIDTLAGNPDYRGIAVVPLDIDDTELERLDRAGVRGVRLTTVARNGANGLSSLEAIATRIAALKWHVQLFVTREHIREALPRIAKLPTPVVLDHLAGLSPNDTNSGELETILGLMGEGRLWVKLSGAYKISLQGGSYEDVTPLARRFLEAAPDRLVWGSDWPHPSLKGRPMPNDGDLLGLLGKWTSDPVLRKRVLVDNPTELYGFPAVNA